MDDEQRKILIIAGPNGAGKSTFASEYLPHEADCPTFVNADLIAAGLSPFEPEKAALRAGRLMLEEIEHHVLAKHNFSIENVGMNGFLVRNQRDIWLPQARQTEDLLFT